MPVESAKPGASSQPVLALTDVSYRYPGSRTGVHSVSLAVPSGSIYGLLGVNGAGKTTLMRLMVGLLTPQCGTVHCLGGNLHADRRRKAASIGSLIEVPSVYQHLTGRQHLRIFSEYTSAPASAVRDVLRLVGIEDAANRIIKQYSLGMKQRLALATALLHDPAVLVLDEPTNGLDPVGIAGMRDLFHQLSKERGKTIVVSSHQLGEVQKIATHIGVMHEGRLRFEGTSDDLTKARYRNRLLRLRVSSTSAAIAVLGAYEVLEEPAQNAIHVQGLDEATAAALIRHLVRADVDVFEAAWEERTLETEFISLINNNTDAR